jgi:oxepin-CoA hydrolase/3-oxo-5,6-dehydrosuberyl-CoA semialdehyde dehydrogenase
MAALSESRSATKCTASRASYVAHALVRLIAESGILPDGALQCVVGPTGDLFA